MCEQVGSFNVQSSKKETTWPDLSITSSGPSYNHYTSKTREAIFRSTLEGLTVCMAPENHNRLIIKSVLLRVASFFI